MIRLYLDQCHWSDMARGWASPEDVRLLQGLAAGGKVLHILSIAHIVETLHCKRASVRRLIVGCLNSMAIPVWVKSLDILVREEVANYFLEFLGQGTDCHIDPFSADFFNSIGQRWPASLPAKPRHPAVKRLVRFIESASPALRRRLLAAGETETAPVRALFQARAGPPSLDTVNAFIALYMPGELPDGTPVGPGLMHAFLAQFDLAQCPALMNVIWIVHHMSRAGMHPEPSDIMDLYHAIPAYSYCDVLVTDKRVADFIRRLKNPPGRFAATFKSLPQALRYIEGAL